ELEDRETGALRARVTMRAGDVAAMPADIRHRGFSPKRSMLLVWENASPELPALYASGQMPPAPVQFWRRAGGFGAALWRGRREMRGAFVRVVASMQARLG